MLAGDEELAAIDDFLLRHLGDTHAACMDRRAGRAR